MTINHTKVGNIILYVLMILPLFLMHYLIGAVGSTILLLPIMIILLYNHKKRLKWLPTIMGLVIAIYMFISASDYAGGGGYGDLAVSLAGILFLYQSLLTTIWIKSNT